jgi:catechol 2,3-dioxygenase-like lactoylglutathione lyase family enzyme
MFQPVRAMPTVAVSDMDRAKQFYGEVLGLKVVEDRPDGMMYDAGGGTVLLVYPSQFAGTAESTCVSFDVSDLDQTVKDLRDSGIVFEDYDLPGLKTVDGIAVIEGLRGAWFKDPDGNILAVGEQM